MEEIFKVQNPFDIEDGLQVNVFKKAAGKKFPIAFSMFVKINI